MTPNLRIRPGERRLAGSAGAPATATIALAAVCALFGCDGRSEAVASKDGAVATRSSIVAMARLEPNGGVVHVPPGSSGIIEEIIVTEGQRVSAGDTLMVLANHELRKAQLEAALMRRERVELRPIEIEAQESKIRGIQAELDYARSEVENQKGLTAKGLTRGKEFDEAQLRVTRHTESLSQAVANLKKIRKELDLERREAEYAIRDAERDVENALVTAPIEGTVLKILRRVGERTGNQVVQMGRMDEMYAMTEVHANDIHYVREGQRAKFTSAALPESLHGTVERIGVIIYNNGVFGDDPSAPRGVRVFQVYVRLDDSAVASRYTNLEGQVRISVQDSKSS